MKPNRIRADLDAIIWYARRLKPALDAIVVTAFVAVVIVGVTHVA